MNESATSRLRIDAHHHLWRYTANEFGWIDDSMAALRRDFVVTDLLNEADTAAIDATVAVQARRSLDETRWLLACAAESERIAGVVGWLPLADGSAAAALARVSDEPRLCGVREIAQGEPSGFLLRPAFQQGITVLTGADLTYDILIYAAQLEEATQLVDGHPQQRFILDHAAKPHIARTELEPWRTHLKQLSQRPNTACKLSGMVTEANWQQWNLDTLRPYLDVCVEAFGPERLLAGSDWPVCLVASSYGRWWQALHTYFAPFSQPEQDAVFGGNAARWYRLHPSLLEQIP